MHALHLEQALLCLLEALSIASFVHSPSHPIDLSCIVGPGKLQTESTSYLALLYSSIQILMQYSG